MANIFAFLGAINVGGDRVEGAVGIGDGLNDKPAFGRGRTNDKWFRHSDKRVAAGNWAEAGCTGEGRGIEVEAVDVGELSKVEAVGEDEVVVVVGEGDIGRMGGVGELDEEAAVGIEVWAGEGGDDAGDLEEDRAVLAGDSGVGIH